MILKPLRRTFWIFVLMMGFGFAAISSFAETAIPNKNVFSVSMGLYYFSTTSSSFGSLGNLQLQYRRSITPEWSLETLFENGLTTTTNLNSIYWGMDLGASYSFLDAFQRVNQVSDVLSVDDSSPYGLLVSAGFMQRSVPLSQVTLSFTGPYIAAVPIYRLNQVWQLQGRLQVGWIKNSGNALRATTLTVGLGFQF